MIDSFVIMCYNMCLLRVFILLLIMKIDEGVDAMKEKMKNLVITNYCSTDKRKYRFIHEVKEDPLIRDFVSPNIEQYLNDSEGVSRLKVGPAYIIADQRKLVGFIRLATLNLNGVLNLHYGVHPSFRKQHYGTKILVETGSYLFQSMPDVKKIELYIHERNTGSLGCASNACFQFDREFYDKDGLSLTKVYSRSL